jgi:hypothetical protein
MQKLAGHSQCELIGSSWMSCNGEERLLWVQVQHNVKMAIIAVSPASSIKKKIVAAKASKLSVLITI